MDKLYDLMTMGFKYQVLSCTAPSELLQVTLNHLDALKALVRTHAETARLVESAQKILLEMYRDLTVGQLVSLRQALCRFFQERKVKVSLFLQDQIQSLDGAIVITHEGPLPPATETPGTIRYFGLDGKMTLEEKIRMKNAENVAKAPDEPFDMTRPTRPSKLGLNLYAKDRKKKGGPLKPARGAPAAKSNAKDAADGKKAATFEPSDSSKAAAKRELNLLANLIGGGAGTSVKDNDKMPVLNLFPDTSLPSQASGDGKSSTRAAAVITFDADDSAELKKRLAESIGMSGDGPNAGAPSKDQDDLLSLMDESANVDL